MRNFTIFAVRRDAYLLSNIFEDVLRIVREYTTLYLPKELPSIELGSWYLPTGRKVTGQIKKILSKHIEKNSLNEICPALFKALSELYAPDATLKAYWGDKELLGTGVYERHTTCFSEDGCNHSSKVFIAKYRRVKCLVLEDTEKGTLSRCLVYFKGGRQIWLTNFYYKNLAENPRVFIEALRRLLKLKAVSWKSDDYSDSLPVYQNGDGIIVYDHRSFDYPYDRIFPCPHCGRRTPERFFYHEEASHTHYLGCSEECGDTRQSDPYAQCHRCDEDIMAEEDAHYSDITGYYYCETCFEELFAVCSKCGCLGNKSEMPISFSNDDWYCTDCAGVCCECGDAILWEDLGKTRSGHSICIACSFQCEVCDRTYSTGDRHEDGDICKDCYTKNEEVAA